MQGGNNLQPTSANAANDFLSTLAFLGQQLRQFSNTMAQQCHQNQPLQSSSLGFSLGVNGQEQAHAHQNQQQPHSQSMLLGGGGGGGQRNGGRMFQHLHHGNIMGSTLDQPQFGGHMMNPPTFPESVASQSMDVQGIMEHLSMLKERVQQLQALVPLISQTAHLQTDSHVVAQQQAASAGVVSIISQLAIVAIGLLPQKPFGNNNAAVASPVNPSTELPLSQLLQAAVSPSANFFGMQQNDPLRAPPQREEGTSSLGNLTGNNDIFGTTSGAAAVIPVVSSGDFSLRSFSGGDHAFPGLNNEDDLSEQQQAATGAMSLHEQMTEGGVGKEFVGSGGGGDGDGNARGAVNNNNPGTLLRSSLAAGRSSGNNFIAHELGAMSNEDVDNYDSGRVDDDDSDGETLPPGSFDLVELDPTEILAEHTHFCEFCGKGFKRDANLRMHMRGHGDEYKTPQALARPDRGGTAPETTKSRRFCCPYAGCKRNKKHRKFQPLKTMLCVKNHYRRSHCPKLLTCQKCKVKKFSVVADLKTHEKHCGCDRWLCSCGSTFSRKDKLYGHLGLFAGHMPVMLHELDTVGGDSGGANSAAEEPPAEATFGSDGKSNSMRFWDS